MILVALRKNDGLSSGRPWLRSVVRTLQLALTEAGFPEEPDGFFGAYTENGVKALQRSHRLLDIGVVGKATWKILEVPIARATAPHLDRIDENLPAFRGDLGWVHLLEGHKGWPYWPGGASGVTLDPGIDLGHADPDFLHALLDKFYAQEILSSQRRAVEEVLGIQGSRAEDELLINAELSSIRISRGLADEVFPVAAKPYWSAICDRFSALRSPGTPPSIQTSLLSISYNRGADNKDLGPLGELLAAQAWVAVAEKIGSMQQDHELEGIRRRRREEAALIRAELECLQA